MLTKDKRMLFKCKKEYSGDPEVYGIDFIVGKYYYGQVEGEDGYYVESTENGTCVYITNEEIGKYFMAS